LLIFPHILTAKIKAALIAIIANKAITLIANVNSMEFTCDGL